MFINYFDHYNNIIIITNSNKIKNLKNIGINSQNKNKIKIAKKNNYI